MKMRVIVAVTLGALAAVGTAQAAVTQPNPNPQMDNNRALIKASREVKNVLSAYRTFELARFEEHLEIARIASPSRQEYYRAKELYDRLKEAGFDESNLVFTGKNNSGIMPGAAVQQVDGLKVYQTCAIIPGTWAGATDGTNGVYARPKVVIEGHIDTVNPSAIPGFDPVAKPDPWYFEPVKMQPVWDSVNNRISPVVETPAELAAITKELAFDANGKIVRNADYDEAIKSYDSLSGDGSNWTDEQKSAYRLYVPGYSDAIGNSIGVYHLAKLFKVYSVKPVHDIWFCFTAGEEGRGNLAGMKQLYGYNQDNAATNPADNGKNKLNIVANLSIDGGTMTVHYLGSYRYEINYKGVNSAKEAAKRIAQIADVKSPSETGDATERTTYTVGIAYQKDDGSTSFEIDMRSPVVPVLNMMKERLYPKFGVGETVDGVEIQSLWFGDRPAHQRADELLATDPLIYAAWVTRDNPNATIPSSSSSLNDNVPGAINVPSVNMNMGATAAGGGNHAFNEWGIRGSLDTEMDNTTRVVETLLMVSGLMDRYGNTIVPAAYGDVAPRHTNEVWDKEDIWN